MRRVGWTFAWALAVVCGVVYLLSSFQMVTDISAFLPEDASEEQRVLREVATGKLARQMVLTVDVPAPHDPADVSRDFEHELLKDSKWLEYISQLDAGMQADDTDAVWALYQARWPYFFAPDVAAAQEALSDAALRASARALRTQLQGPLSMMVSRIAPSDPFLVMPALLERLEHSHAGGVSEKDGRLVTEDGRYAVLFLTSRASAFDSERQREVIAGIQRAFEAVNGSYDHALTLEMSGVNRIAISAQETIERDIQRISVLSSLLIFAMLWVVFGGIRIAFLAMMSMGTGVVMALCASHAIFGQVHGISLAFGASLIGLAIDYVLHLYSHVEHGRRQAHAVLRRILPALLIAASSTLTGFVALSFTGFPGLQEVAVFAVVGLGSALATVVFVVVRWLPETMPMGRVRTTLTDGLLRAFSVAQNTRWPIAAVLVIVGLGIAWGAPQIRWSAQMGDSSTFDQALVEEEERVRARVSRFDQSRLILSVGSTMEEALQSAERVASVLRSEDLVGDFASLSQLLPSTAHQVKIAEQIQSDETLQDRFESAFEAEGFRAEMFQPFYDQLHATLPPPLDATMLQDSPLAGVVDSLSAETADGYVILTPLRDVRDSAALHAAMAPIDGAVFVDEREVMGDVDGRQRRRIMWAMSIGFLVVCGLLYGRYRKARLVLSALVAPSLSVLWTWSMLAVLGIELDLILVAFSLLIISLGVDYGVFLIDTLHPKGPDMRAALFGVVMAAMTTLLGFGLLATSSFPMLHRVGLVALLGVSAAMVLSPVARMLARSGAEEG